MLSPLICFWIHSPLSFLIQKIDGSRCFLFNSERDHSKQCQCNFTHPLFLCMTMFESICMQSALKCAGRGLVFSHHGGFFMRGIESRELGRIPAIRVGIRLQFEWPQGTPFLPNNSSRRGDFVCREWNMVLEAIFMPLLFLLSGVFDTLCTQHLVYLGASSRLVRNTHHV